MFSANTSQVSEDRLYVEDVFSTYLYSGTSGAQSINNGIDTLNKGGLVWMKNRGSALSHILIDTAQGCTFAGGKNLISNSTNAAGTVAANTFQFDSTGFSFGSAASGGGINASGNTYASWTFRKAPKFFDVVTYTGDGTANRAIPHSLGLAPGCIIVKRTDATGVWITYHVSIGAGGYLLLNGVNSTVSNAAAFPSVTSTTFTPTNSTSWTYINDVGATYVAYLFAHDATSDGIIQCGSYTGNGTTSGPVVNLGWEPQWLLVKEASNANDWYILDTIRGWPTGRVLYPNLSNAEDGGLSGGMRLDATGFQPTQSWTAINRSGSTYIYIAIRRGPMRTPTSGTSVFAPITWSGTGTSNRVITGAPTASDSILINTRNQAANYWNWNDRLRGAQNTLYPYATSAENAGAGATYGVSSINMDGFTQGSQDGLSGGYNASGATAFAYFFKRAPSFFDEVCWTGNGVNPQVLSHNLGVAPQLIINKTRSTTSDWDVTIFNAAFSGGVSAGYLNGSTNFTDGSANSFFNSPTASTVSVTATGGMNTSGRTNVSYLFASCPGVSKVTNFTGTGALQTINCGFASGARFVLIKRTDAAGDWYIYDSSRGISSANDPYLLLNSTAAEVTNTNWVDTDASGFKLTAAAGNNVNINGASYIALAIS